MSKSLSLLFKKQHVAKRSISTLLLINLKQLYCTDSSAYRYLFHEPYTDDLKSKFLKNLTVCHNFISENEERNLLDEIYPRLRRMQYQFDHWDNAIQGFKEFEKEKWNESNKIVIENIRKYAFKADKYYLPDVHVLDLAEEGHIKAHIDSVRFCGNTIAGLSLLTGAVMRFFSEKHNLKVDVLLERRSLYIMKDFVRHEFTHEVLGNEHSIFMGEKIHKARRISLVCRSKPNQSSTEDDKM